MIRLIIICALTVYGVSPLSTAFPQPDQQMDQEVSQSTSAPDGEKEAETENEEESSLSITQHTMTIDGVEIAYTATAGMMAMEDEHGKNKADIFFVAYTRDGVDNPRNRPVTFTFNGGPGSSSVWLHLGAFGPQRVKMEDAAVQVSPPYELVENASSILDLTDLVFIDPVTTGYSRAAEGEDPGQFHGVREDINSVADFIRRYTTQYERWSSPKFLAGESYGTTRAAGLSGRLQDRYGMALNGIVLVSSILNFQTARFNRGNDLPYIVFLPTMTATAWYHGKLEGELQRDLSATLRAVESFALHDYQSALMKGSDLSADDRRSIVEQLARYTGLSEEFIDQSNLRVGMGRFAKELLRDQRRTVGRLDSRFKGIDTDAAGASMEYDPSMAAIMGPYTAMLNDYLRRELKYESDLNYEILTGRVHPWNYSSVQNQYLNVGETLRSAMTKNPALKVFVASGYYDFATPYFATDYTMNHLGLDPSLREHITQRYYAAGHMMYIHGPSLRKLKSDLAEFYRASAGN